MYQLAVGLLISVAYWPSQLLLLVLNSPTPPPGLQTPAGGSQAGSGLPWAGVSQAKHHSTCSQPSPRLRPYYSILFLGNCSVDSNNSRSLETETSLVSPKQPHGVSGTTPKANVCSCVTMRFLLVVQLSFCLTHKTSVEQHNCGQTLGRAGRVLGDSLLAWRRKWETTECLVKDRA